MVKLSNGKQICVTLRVLIQISNDRGLHLLNIQQVWHFLQATARSLMVSVISEWMTRFILTVNKPKELKKCYFGCTVQYSKITPQVLSQAVVHCLQATPVLVSPLSLNNTATKELLQTLWYINIYLWLMSKCHINIVYFLTIAME